MSKKNVISKAKNHSLWIQSYLSQPLVVQHLIVFIKQLMSIPKQDTILLNLFQKLIEKPELSDITKECPQLETFTQWLYYPNVPPDVLCALNEILDMHDFIAFLKIIVNGNTTSQQVSEINCTKIVAEGVEKIRSIYQHTYNEIFLIVMTSPYCNYNSEQNILISLSLDNVKNMLESILKEEAFFSITSSNHEALQAYLLYLAASRCQVQLLLDLLKEFELSPLPSTLHYANEVLINSSLTIDIQSKLKGYLEKAMRAKKSTKKSEGDCIDQQLTCNNISINEESLKAHNLLHSLNLCKYYPKKLRLQDALKITQVSLTISLADSACTPEKLPGVILHKLMSYDSKCRSDVTLVSKIPQKANKQGITEVEPEEILGIHPMDCLLAIFLCCDDFLLQDLFSRLAKCQFAVPFLLTDPFTKKLTFPLWAMRSIVKEFFLRRKGDYIQQTSPIAKYPMKIVSILRLGAQQQFGKSKSRIFNEVISGGNNNHFFHYDLEGGQHPCVLGSGIVDVCWYLPSGKASDVFPEAISFLNLHGDARFYSKQCLAISKISSVCFAVVTENIVELKPEIKAVLNSLHERGKLAFLNATKEESSMLKNEFCNSKSISLKQTAAQIKSSIQNYIRYKLENVDDNVSKKTIESLCNSFGHDVLIDELSEPCKEGKRIANFMKDILPSISNNKRDFILPLQGKTWKDWASADKEHYRVTQRKKLTVEKYVEEVKENKKSLRLQQQQQIEMLPPLVECFVTSLQRLKGADNFMTRNYFLQFLKLELNYLSQNSISEKQHQFKLLRIEKQIKGSRSCNQERIDHKLLRLQQDIVETSLGLEHLLRELGQIYEGAKT